MVWGMDGGGVCSDVVLFMVEVVVGGGGGYGGDGLTGLRSVCHAQRTGEKEL